VDQLRRNRKDRIGAQGKGKVGEKQSSSLQAAAAHIKNCRNKAGDGS